MYHVGILAGYACDAPPSARFLAAALTSQRIYAAVQSGIALSRQRVFLFQEGRDVGSQCASLCGVGR